MSHPHTEITEVTKLVLYGWGYPALFNSRAGIPLQNRLVKFSAKSLPVIEAASQDAFLVVLPKLEMIRKTYVDRLTSSDASTQPLWVWVDTPERLSSHEILNYQKKFADWAEAVTTQPDRSPNNSALLAKFLAQMAAKFQGEMLPASLTRWRLESWRQWRSPSR
ncbi:MAG TPA: hypothetical protein V6C57_04200 [Coleofasciculaceae cyanobacterium]